MNKSGTKITEETTVNANGDAYKPREYTATLARLRPGKWQTRSAYVLCVFRLLTFTAGITQSYIATSDHINLVSPNLLLATAGIYILITTVYFIRRPQGGISLLIILGVDIGLSIFLLTVSGGLHSPFLLFTLVPVLIAAIYLDIKIAAAVALASAVYVIAAHLVSPVAPEFSGATISYLLIYLMTAGLVAVLPYVINVNVRQSLRYNNILQERRRLSWEIHDGAVQTISALRWQVQLLQRQLSGKGIYLTEVYELEKLAEKAQQETRESLELLRNFTGDGSFLPHLRDYIEHLKQESSIKYELNTDIANLKLVPLAELELLRICQEALTNIRQHAVANNVKISVAAYPRYIKVSITDDGIGFDIASFYRQKTTINGGHGLAVMAERAKSIGGKFRVISLPGHGTDVQVEIPLNSYGDGSLWETP